MKMKWYAVYTKPRCERKVAEILSRKKIENYCPLNRIERYWSGSKKFIEEPLFSNYLFVRGIEMQHTQLKKIHGVVNLVYWLGKPVVVTDLEIETLRRFLNDHINLTVEKTAIDLYNLESKRHDPLSELDIRVISAKNKKVYVNLSSIGYRITAEIESPNVKVIPSASQITQSTFITPLSY